MPRGGALLLASLLLAGTLSAIPGLGSPVKEKRGWTLNSAGYLLGPHAIDNHRSFHDKHGLAGKRELPPEDEGRPGSFDRPLPGDEKDVERMIIEFLTFLHLREAGALEHVLPSAVSSEDTEQS
ncbi:galanin and GMAP prepropeptide [Rhinolophus ferrumequinum]|uniref:Galanin peptides n=1 Tax=Rhinolophus ferrumequinum TaxID=59479 RepID=A0A671G1V1_RHIFE|nr:galanin peptides [Rhinolophus ferrumequinum]KAF6333105.1 galanin and GMAP prepropeptide [Rhinolophus ferrumequinum]